MRVMLAPMEGVIDHSMRELLCQAGSIDRCVTEFIRTTNQLLPSKIFYRYCPELSNQGHTSCGVPVYIQLLGSNPLVLAENAARAAQLGAPGIDLNFGCPAKKVNNSGGGSILLQEPSLLFDIVQAVRSSVPADIPVTAKIRLGFNDSNNFHQNVKAIIDAGANELTIHARTKRDGYKPPAYWQYLADVSSNSPIPIIANGEIWNTENYSSCLSQSRCHDVMLGRGILANPNLSTQIKAFNRGETCQPLEWPKVCRLVELSFLNTLENYELKYMGGRVKQWLVYLKRQYPEALELFEAIKPHREPKLYQQAFKQSVTQYQLKTTNSAPLNAPPPLT